MIKPHPQAISIPSHHPAGAGLEPWPDIDAKDLASGTPKQRGRYYFNDPDIGLSCGVWDCTAFETTMAPYSVDEFMILLEGTIHIDQEDGRSMSFQAGDCFVIPRGLRCVWRQPGYVRKIFAIFEDPHRPIPAQPAYDRAIKIDPRASLLPSPGPDASQIIGTVPEWRDKEFYKDASGRWSIGLWQSSAYERIHRPFPSHELMHVIEGNCSLTASSGKDLDLASGDTAFVAKDSLVGWRSLVPVRKIYCSLASL